jgi:hypothetical protein
MGWSAMGWLLLFLAIYVLAIWIKKTESGKTLALFSIAGLVLLVAKCSGL